MNAKKNAVSNCLYQAAELVCNNLDTYHKQLKEIRDYLEQQLTVNS